MLYQTDKKNIWTLVSIISFIDSFQFLSFFLDSLVKKLDKDHFKYPCQKFDRNTFGLVKQK